MESTPLHLHLHLHLLLLLLSSQLLVVLVLLITTTTTTTTAAAASATLFPKEAQPTKSGYLPVDGTSKSAMFYTFYEAQTLTTEISDTPLLIWLQGGPGCSSQLGNFFELGPWRVSLQPPVVLSPNPAPWNRIFGLLFLDNPIGSGFSVAASPQHIPSDQPAVARHLFFAIQSFLSSNPSFRSRPLYVTGESYAGKYVPAIGHHILHHNSRLPPSRRVNLHGVAIGNGLTHPVTQVATHAATAYYSGLINSRQQAQLEELQAEAVKLALEGRNWSEATDARNRVLILLSKATGLATLYDLRRKKPYETEMVTSFLRQDEVKAALGVDNRSAVWEDCSDLVDVILHSDVMKSVKFMVEDLLLNKTKVLLYQGQFDLRDGVVSTEAWVEQMDWDRLERFLAAERKIWKVKGEVSGYVQRWGALTHAVVGGAGHLVPADQPVSSQAMIEDWVLEKGLFGDNEEEVSTFGGSL